MFISTVCVLFQSLKLKWPKNKNIYEVTSEELSPPFINLAPFTRGKTRANETQPQSIKSTEFNYKFIVLLVFTRLHRVYRATLNT